MEERLDGGSDWAGLEELEGEPRVKLSFRWVGWLGRMSGAGSGGERDARKPNGREKREGAVARAE